MAGKKVTIISLPERLLRAKAEKINQPSRGVDENVKSNTTSTGSFAVSQAPVASPDAASPSSARTPGSPTNAKTEAETQPAALMQRAEARRKEAHLRKMAIRQMSQWLAGKPLGTTTAPPLWFRRSEDRFSIAYSRPLSWIKDWRTGEIRPRTMRDDFTKRPAFALNRVVATIQPDTNGKKRKAPMDSDSDSDSDGGDLAINSDSDSGHSNPDATISDVKAAIHITVNRVRAQPQKRRRLSPVAPRVRHCTTSLLTLNPNKIVSVEAKIDTGYNAEGESGSD
ncbi:hypothetical protein V8F20_002395 [Naviculisporaceae sp. PSN 640]